MSIKDAWWEELKRYAHEKLHAEPTKPEWEDEPEIATWVTAAMLPAHICRDEKLGYLCGYVGVRCNNPHYEKLTGPLKHLIVHGRVSWASHLLPGGPNYKNVWWIGFDCAQYGDVIPADKSSHRDYFTYRNFAYVTEECEKLAAQLANHGDA